MIVSSTTASAAVILGPDGERVRVRCLAPPGHAGRDQAPPVLMLTMSDDDGRLLRHPLTDPGPGPILMNASISRP